MIIDIPQKQKSNEWYTPAKYVDAAREVMGGIDLDPASCELANQTVKAKRYYTQEDDGLKQDWACSSLWLNPPYHALNGEDHPQPTWTKKLIREYKQELVKQAIILISPTTKHRWFHDLLDYPICFLFSRIYFTRPGQEPQDLRDGNIFAYLGPNETKFTEVFSQFGRIAKAIDAPKEKLMPHSLWEDVEV